MEEGEIALPANPGLGDRTWGPQERAATALNLALYEALSGDGAAALAAAEAALGIADAAGCDMVRSCYFLCSGSMWEALGRDAAALLWPPRQSYARQSSAACETRLPCLLSRRQPLGLCRLCNRACGHVHDMRLSHGAMTSTVSHAQLQEQVWQELLALAAAALLREGPAASPSPDPAPVAPAAPAAPQPPAAPAAAGGHADSGPNPGAAGWTGWGETGQRDAGAPLASNAAEGTDSEQTAQGGTAARPAGPAAGPAAEEGAGVPRAARFGAFLRLFRRFAAWHRTRSTLQPLQRAEDTVSVRHFITSYSIYFPCCVSPLSSITSPRRAQMRDCERKARYGKC